MFNYSKYILLLCLFVCFANKFTAQPLQGRQLADSLVNELNIADNDSDKVELLFGIADILREVEPQSSYQYAKQGIDLSRKMKWDKGIAELSYVAGFGLINRNDYARSLQHLLESSKLAKKLNDTSLLTAVNNALAILYGKMDDPERAIKSYEDNLDLCISLKDTSCMAMSYLNIGVAYSDMGQRETAVEYTKNALSYAHKINYAYCKAVCYANLGNDYAWLGDTSVAVSYYDSCMAMLDTMEYIPFSIHMQAKLGDIYWGKGEYKKAEKYHRKALELAEDIEAVEQQSIEWEALSGIYEGMDNAKEALKALRMHIRLRDSAGIDEKRAQFLQLEDSMRVAVEKKELKARVQRQRNYTIAGIVALLVVLSFTFFIIKERRKSDRLLLNILPAEIAKELKRKGESDAHMFDNVTVLFTDFVGFTKVSEQLTPKQLVNELHECFKAFDEIAEKYHIEKIKTIGDAYLAVCGLPVADNRHAEKVINAAIEILAFMKDRRAQLGDKTFEIRIGVHSGEVVAGIVGVKKFAYDIWGDTVNTAARMEQNSEPGKINISQTTYELVQHKFTYTYRGELEAKNKGRLKMYFVES